MTEAELTPLQAPRDGVPDVVVDERRLREAAAALAAGSGPVAVDAERASGYRYGQAAFLVQLRREGAGTWLVDPVACPDLSELGAALSGTEWVLHAASQDLPCLAEVGMRPTTIFDTELAARLAGLPKVGLAAVVEDLLGLTLAKEHSAVDWSTRPLPAPWLLYAALDVEVLVELRDVLAARLAEQGKLDWAREEFAAVVAAGPPAPRTDPWRRTSGMHKVRTRRQVAAVRELWLARDDIARKRDVSPGRVLPDAAIVEAALAMPGDADALHALPGFRSGASRRGTRAWLAALDTARRIPDSALPPGSLPSDGPPPPRAWADRDPEAAARLARARSLLADLGERLAVPVENLMTPDTVRRVLWEPPTAPGLEPVADALRARGAREWQVTLVAPLLLEAMSPAPVDEHPVEGPAAGVPPVGGDAGAGAQTG